MWWATRNARIVDFCGESTGVADCACLDFRICVRLLLELYCVVVKHFAFFTVCEKLTMALTFTSLPWNLTLLFPRDVVVVSDLIKNINWRINGFGEKRQGSADLQTPIHPPPRAIAQERKWRTTRGGARDKIDHPKKTMIISWCSILRMLRILCTKSGKVLYFHVQQKVPRSRAFLVGLSAVMPSPMGLSTRYHLTVSQSKWNLAYLLL